MCRNATLFSITQYNSVFIIILDDCKKIKFYKYHNLEPSFFFCKNTWIQASSLSSFSCRVDEANLLSLPFSLPVLCHHYWFNLWPLTSSKELHLSPLADQVSMRALVEGAPHQGAAGKTPLTWDLGLILHSTTILGFQIPEGGVG